MQSATSRRVLIQTASVAAFAALLMWGGSSFLTARKEALAAQEGLEACRLIWARIKNLSQAPALAQAQALEQPELARRIEDAAKAAGISSSSIERIAPDSPRPLGDSPYLETPTQVQLRQVTLRQVLTFLHNLSADPAVGKAGLGVQAVRLSAPRGAESGDLWRLEAVLTYLIYAPKNALPVKTGG